MRILILATLILLPASALAADGPHFNYDHENGPEVWATLSEHWSACGEGKHQSPIDLHTPSMDGTVKVTMSYEPTALNMTHHTHVEDIIDNGHTIQVAYDEASELTVGDTTYELKQFHFHTPSEHTLDGMHFPMEMHMVHATDDGKLAVFGIFFKRGAHNAAFDPIVQNLPNEEGQNVHVEGSSVDLDDMLPGNRAVYSYSGSLTTPPCSEGVAWFLAMEPVELSTHQIEAFTSRLRQNNRPPQPLNDRSIAKSTIQ